MTDGTQVEIVTVERSGALAGLDGTDGMIAGTLGLTDGDTGDAGPPGWVDGTTMGAGVDVTGHTVVEVMTEDVFEPTGQFVTVGAQDVMVYSMVV
jgi:hypothetical protein